MSDSHQYGPPAARGLYRPEFEHDSLRRRLRRAHQGQAQPPDPDRCGRSAVPHGSPRRVRLRAEHGRRRRHSHGAAARVSRQGREERARRRPAAAGPVRRRHRIPADRRRRAGALQGSRRTRSCAEQGQTLVGWRHVPTRAGRSRHRPHRPRRGEPHIEQLVIAAGDGLSKATRSSGSSISSASRRATSCAATRRSRRRSMFYVCSLSTQGDHLQGHAHDRAALQISIRTSTIAGLHRPSGDGPFAVLDEHVPVLGPCAADAVHEPQRRDQHAARQHELDAAPAKASSQSKLFGRVAREAVPDRRARLQRLGHVRQRARVPADDAAARCRNP